jgi:NAD-dependent deacetylase
VKTLRGQPPKIVAFTGAALSRDSGFAPFDPETIPPGLRLEELVTREGFARDPGRVHQFYNRRRRELLMATPNAAHEALAVLDAVQPREVLVVTRNIDDLHERAGSQAVIHTHGELLKARCTICMKISDRLDDITGDSACPVCGNAGHLRPHVVWVGEEPQGIARVYEALAQCRLFLAIGAAGGSEPARSFLAAANRAGARTVEFPDSVAAAFAGFDERHPGPLTETVAAYVKQLKRTRKMGLPAFGPRDTRFRITPPASPWPRP